MTIVNINLLVFSDSPEIVEAVLSAEGVKNVKDMSGRWFFTNPKTIIYMIFLINIMHLSVWDYPGTRASLLRSTPRREWQRGFWLYPRIESGTAGMNAALGEI